MSAATGGGTAVYMPILKWKQGELQALERITTGDRPLIIPMVDIIEDSIDVDLELATTSPALPFQRSATRLARAWPSHPTFVDSDELDGPWPTGPQPVFLLFAALRAAGVCAVPVARIGCSTTYIDALAAIIKLDHRGCALRLSVDDLVDPSLTASITAVVGSLGVKPQQIDLVLDFAAIDATSASATYLAASSVLPALPTLTTWRSVIFAASSFPQDLSAAGTGFSTIPRAEWALYQSLLVNRPGGRAVSFGDYAIAHPIYRQVGFPGSAAIRYTHTNEWLVNRGRAVTGPVHGGYGQFQTLSAQLVAHGWYCGPNHCWGDQYIMACSQGGGPGNNTTWRAVGTNHHLTYVAQQCASHRAPGSGISPPPAGP